MLKQTANKVFSMTMAFLLVLGPSAALGQKKGAEKGGQKSLSSEQKASHFLDRASFGARPGEIERVMKMGWQKYLDAQLHPERIADDLVEQKLKNLESIHLSNEELARYYPPPQVVREALKSKGLEVPETPGNQNPPQGNAPANNEGFKRRREAMQALQEMGYKRPQQVVQEIQAAKILRAAYSERQLQEVMADFWFNHFNVFIQKGADRVLTTSYERDVIRPKVFGKFEDLLLATAESPAMLFYLDNWQSVSPNAGQRGFGRNQQNQIRRQERLRRIGRSGIGDLPDGEIMRNNGQAPQSGNNAQIQNRPRRGINENYAREIMELHTLGVDGGYTQKDVQEVARCFTGWTIRAPRAGAEFIFNPRMHDDGEKIVLGRKIPAGGGKKDGETVIKILAQHPSTAKFISTKLARKFVSDNPPQSLIDRMAQTYTRTDGDIREVLRAMFNSQEFWAPESYRAKIKTPFEMTVSAVRALGAETNGGPGFHRWIAQMGEGLFLAQPPTGYPDTSEHWVNTGALLERMNFALALSANRIPGTRVNLNNLAPGENLSQQSKMIDHFARILLRGELSAQSRATIDKSLKEQSDPAMNSIDVAKVVGLILGSPEFQRQ